VVPQAKRWRWPEGCGKEQYKRKNGQFSKYWKDEADSTARILPTLVLYKDRWQGRFDPWLLVEAGHFEGEQWVVDERRAGDETDFGLILAMPGQAVHAVFD
jgi:hypothetical protein